MTQILILIRQLESQEQLALMQELANLLQRQTARARRKVTEFRGVGKRTWQGVNIDDYIRGERESWG
jgi:hypothetical protein